MRKATILFNPNSGRRGRKRDTELDHAIGIIQSAGVRTELTVCRSSSEATDHARVAVAAGSDTVFACGGDGTIHDVIPGMPAFDAGLSPYMKIIAVGGQEFSISGLSRAVHDSKSSTSPIVLLVSNSGSLKTHEIAYHGGLRGPHLERADGSPDYLSEILKPLASGK